MQYLISRYDKLMTGDFMRREILKYENIRNLRIDHNYTQKQIAELLHVSQNTYSQYENKRRQIPLGILVRLAVFYNTSTDYLLGLTDVSAPSPRSKRIDQQ